MDERGSRQSPHGAGPDREGARREDVPYDRPRVTLDEVDKQKVDDADRNHSGGHGLGKELGEPPERLKNRELKTSMIALALVLLAG